MVTIQHGGLAFLLIYSFLTVTLGAPLLLLEFSLGQYSALPPSHLYRHLCPLLAGLGLSLSLLAALRAMLELAVLMWAGRGIFYLFSQQTITKNWFSQDVLSMEDSSLLELGSLRTQLLVVLGIASVCTFVMVVAGTRSMGKVSMLAVPACFMVLVTLTIRVSLAPGGPQGVLTLISPVWSVLTEPSVWLEAVVQVVFSLQLGIGAFTTFASYNKYEHNIVRDSVIMAVSHLVWTLLSVILTLALLGLSQQPEGLPGGPQDTVGAMTVSWAGRDIWLAAVTIVEHSFVSLSHGWLWAGLYFVLLILVGVTSLFGFLEVVTSSLISIQPSCTRYKPLLALCVLGFLFLVCLVLATQGGIHVYHLLTAYIASWPALLFSLLTVLAAVLCHGTTYLMKDLGNMTKLRLPHWLTSHLSVTYYSVLPLTLTAALSWHLCTLTKYRVGEPLLSFGISLPPDWGLPVAWSLAILPLTPLVLGAILHIVWVTTGVPISMHLRRLLKPTDSYYKNEHSENVASSQDTLYRTSTRA